MTNIELAQLRNRLISSPLFRLIPETPEGNFAELALHALDYADEQKAEAKRVDELYTGLLEKARDLKNYLNAQVSLLRGKANRADRLEQAAIIEKELLEYGEI